MNYLLLLLVAAIWGSTFIVIKDSLNSFDPFVILTIRFSIASLLLFIWIKWKKLNPLSFIKLGVITGILQFLTYAPQTIGLQITSPSKSAFATGMFIIFTPIFGFVLYKKKFRIIDYMSIVIAIIGLWIVTGGISNFNYGDMITLITAAAIGLLIIVTSEALKKGADPVVITFQQLLITAAMSFVATFILHEDFSPKDFILYLPITYLAVFASFFAYTVQNSKLKVVNPIIASIVLSTEPLFALIFSWIFGYEAFSIMKLVGGLLILFAIVLPDTYSYIQEKIMT